MLKNRSSSLQKIPPRPYLSTMKVHFLSGILSNFFFTKNCFSSA